MIDWIIKYWLEVGFGLLISVIGFGIRWIAKKLKEEYQEQNSKMIEYFDQKLKEQKSELIEMLNDRLAQQETKLLKADSNIRTDVTKLQIGIEAVHNKSFCHSCRELLKPGHIITQAEQEDIDNEFKIYVELGGDPHLALYEHVKSKYEQGLTNRG